MNSQYVRYLLRSAAAGSILLLSVSPVTAGRMFPDEPSRPHIHAGTAPNWGYNQTCWQRFPPLPPCEGEACHADPGQFSGQAYPGQLYQPGEIYTPQSGLVIPGQSFSTLPSSLMPANSEGLRYAPGSVTNPNPASSAYPAPAELTPYQGPPSQVPPIPDPSLAFPGPINATPAPVQDFRAVPAPTSQLPPLPAPPVIVPPVPGQTSMAPQQLMLDASGRLVIASSASSSAQHGSQSGRYGSRSRIAVAQQPEMMIQGMARLPVQFANAPASAAPNASRYGRSQVPTVPSSQPAMMESHQGVPVRAISQSQPVSAGSRYGAARHAAPAIPEQRLEPLSSTPPASPYR